MTDVVVVIVVVAISAGCRHAVAIPDLINLPVCMSMCVRGCIIVCA